MLPPVAQARTDEGGYFKLGVERTASLVYEIRVISEQFVDHVIPNLTITKASWYDAGVIQLERGAVLQGRVSIKGSNGLPAPNARVMLKANTLIPSFTVIPEREEGIVAVTDSTGFYRIENAPPGAANVAAVAPGYARIESGKVIQAARTNEVDFELPPGLSISGFVQGGDEARSPIPNVKIEALAMTAKATTKNVFRSERDGSFEIIGLVDGPYMLTATAPGYVRWQYKPIRAGETDVEIILEKQGSGKLRVYDKNGRLVTARYRVSVKRYFPEHNATGSGMGSTVIEPRAIRPDRAGICHHRGAGSGQLHVPGRPRGPRPGRSPNRSRSPRANPNRWSTCGSTPAARSPASCSIRRANRSPESSCKPCRIASPTTPSPRCSATSSRPR